MPAIVFGITIVMAILVTLMLVPTTMVNENEVRSINPIITSGIAVLGIFFRIPLKCVLIYFFSRFPRLPNQNSAIDDDQEKDDQEDEDVSYYETRISESNEELLDKLRDEFRLNFN